MPPPPPTQPGQPGFNSFHGWDNGPMPPSFAPMQPPGVPQHGYWNTYVPQQYTAYGMPYPNFNPAQSFFAFPSQPYASSPPNPLTNTIPGIHLSNPHGGTGLPPGYNYIFPSKNCIIHVFKTPEKPWRWNMPLWSSDQSKFVKLLVPTNTTIKDLMMNLGCDNKEAAKNELYELSEGGNGKWLKGMAINGVFTHVNEKGGQADKCKKTIKDFGWDEKRTGKLGQAPIVWLYATKN